MSNKVEMTTEALVDAICEANWERAKRVRAPGFLELVTEGWGGPTLYLDPFTTTISEAQIDDVRSRVKVVWDFRPSAARAAPVLVRMFERARAGRAPGLKEVLQLARDKSITDTALWF